ncbi:MAG TPA: AAA family ATPase [Ktedonobacterales bacterium]
MASSEERRPPKTAARSLHIDVLGFPVVRVAGIPLALSDQKAQALLLYLAVTEQGRSRDYLAALLWSELPDSNARHSLRSSLYHLRRVLGSSDAAEALMASRSWVSLWLDEDACDVTRFRRLLTTSDERQLADAVSLYRGPLLEGFSLPDAPIFEDWLRSERALMNQLYLSGLDRLAGWAEAREAWEEAIDYVQRMVQVDSLNEAAQQRLIRLCLNSGATVRALRQYQLFEAELKHELGLAPTPDTQELFQRILRSRDNGTSLAPSAEPRSHTSRSSPRRDNAEWVAPFVGRDDTLDRLVTLCADVAAGRGCAVLLDGERGMGKTRLLTELASRLMERSPTWTVLIGACSPFDDLIAYGPFYDAFQSAAVGDLSDLVTSDQGDKGAGTGAVMWRVMRALRLLAQAGPVMIAVDDLHWANSSTLQMFGFLATHLRNAPVLLVGTIEQLDAIPTLRPLLMVGRPHGEVHLAPVKPLPPDAVMALLQALDLSQDATGSLAEWLQTRSGGSPFMIGEILAQLRADGILTPSDGRWRFNEGRWLRRRASFALPETTYDLIAWRLASLSPEALDILDVLAVAGQPLPFALLHDLPGIHGEHALHVVDDLLTKGILVEAADEALALPHHLLAETLLSRMSQLRQRALHRQLLEAIEQCPALQARFPLHQVALHAVAAEDVARARRYGLRALDELMRSSHSSETLNFAQRVHDLLAPTASPEERLWLTRAVGQFHESLGQLDAAKRWRERQLAIASAADDLAAQMTAHFDMGELALVSGDFQVGAESAETGLRLVESAAPRESFQETMLTRLSSRGYRLLGASLAMEGSDLPAADRYLQQAAAARHGSGELDKSEDSSDLCAILFELGNVAAQRGDMSRALTCYEEAGRAAESTGAHYYHALAYNNFAYHSLLLGQIEAAEQAAKRGLRIAEAHELVGALVHLYSTVGEIRLYQAEWKGASESFERGRSLAEDLGNLERQAGHLAGLALAARGAHHVERAMALLEDALALIPEQGHWHLRARIQLWMAETQLLLGKRVEARHSVERAHTTARTQERSLLLIQSEQLSARLLAADGDWPEASALFTRAIQRALELSLTLEAARIQAVWGQAILHSVTSPQTPKMTHKLLAAARRTFVAHNARADLLALDEVALTDAH